MLILKLTKYLFENSAQVVFSPIVVFSTSRESANDTHMIQEKKVHKTVEKISSKLLWRDHGFISLLHHLPVDMQTPILNSRLDTEQFEFELENKFTGSLNVKNVIIRKFTSILHSMHR